MPLRSRRMSLFDKTIHLLQFPSPGAVRTMATTRRTSLSADGPKPKEAHPHSIQEYEGLNHPPHLRRLDEVVSNHATVRPLGIEVDDDPDGEVPGFLHLPPGADLTFPAANHRTGAILVSGAGGGVSGPSSIYLSLACKLATLGSGVPTLRLDYRYPARNRYCTRDVRAAMSYLESAYGLNRFVLVGWSFGGAPVFTVGASDERVVGCATVASQTADTEGIRKLAPRPLLLLHGKDDRTLSYSCSERLYEQYGGRGWRGLKLFEGDNHALTGNAVAAEAMLCEFVDGCASISVDDAERRKVMEKDLVEDGEREEMMRKGGDLRGAEHIA